MADRRIDRIRAGLAQAGLDAVVLTNQYDVLYATGYASVLERWNLQEPLAAAIVAADPRIPVVLAIPEANVALLAVMKASGRPDRAGEIRVFELLTFCEMARQPDPWARQSSIAEASIALYGERVRGRSEPDVVASLATTLVEHGLPGAKLGFDDLRVGFHLKRDPRLAGIGVEDGLDLMIRARSVKSPEEIEAFRRAGIKGDLCIEHAASLVRPGVTWTDLQRELAAYMVSIDVMPLDEGVLLFGGAFDGEFVPELFRTRYDKPLAKGQIVILETLGQYEQVWIDINRTAYVGTPPAEYVAMHDAIRDGFLKAVENLRPGRHTADCARIAYEYVRGAGVPAPEKLLTLAHGIGHTPVEMPVGFPSYGLRGAQGFVIEEDMVISLDCLYFGSKLGPCHMENVYVIEAGGPVPTYAAPLTIRGPRNV
ncbi:MAG: M24 family metallopeptidase [Steroidobacteraceae bacterium]|nr:M24 family metallopeptidase [Steroidobacteraceae bacterium]